MQMSNQDLKNKKINKSQILLIGSFLIFIGVCVLSSNYFKVLKEDIYSKMKIDMTESISEDLIDLNDYVYETNITQDQTIEKKEEESVVEKKTYTINWDQYYGILEIPDIGLKRGYYNVDNPYNNIKYNVTLVSGSSTPDVDGGNLILMAHSGNAWISYFAYLYKLGIGSHAYITYNGVKYEYSVVDIYNVEKNGIAVIKRNKDKRCLTLITCTKDSDTEQTIYILEQTE